MSQYYLHRNGQNEGPYGEDALKAGVHDGSVQPGELCWKEGMPEWVTVKSLIPTPPVYPLPPSVPQPPALPMAPDPIQPNLTPLQSKKEESALAASNPGYLRSHLSWEITLIVLSVIYGFIHQHLSPLKRGMPAFDGTMGAVIAEAAGAAFSSMAMPFFILLIPHVIFRAINKTWRWENYLRYYTIIWALLIAGGLFEITTRRGEQDREPTPTYSQGINFAPAFSEFAVVFPSDPKIINISVTGGAIPCRAFRPN